MQCNPENKQSGKPEIKCGICGNWPLIIRCFRKHVYSAKKQVQM